MTTVITQTLPPPPFSEKEALRYAGCREADEALLQLLRACFTEAERGLVYKVCYRVLPLEIRGSRCDFGCFAADSEKLAKNLAGCREVLLFAATVGIEPDRLITRYSRISPVKGVLLQGIGAERIEALCDAFCQGFPAILRPRFSPGYGDLPLALQKEIFGVLDCPRRIGLTLNESLLMSPTKSVTAFAGIEGKTE